MTKTLGDRIRELRDAADLSLRDLSKNTGGLTASFLSDIELGRRFPSDDALARLAKALNTTPEDLRKYDTRPPVNEMKRMSAQHPALGLAFRKITAMSPEEILKMVDKSSKAKKG
ncbi:MAG: helix-turn-helix transcriptional regulator [Acidobacteriota bacterium]